MYYKNYGRYNAKPSAINIFDNTFKISQGKMNLKTIYSSDFKDLDVKTIVSQRGPLVTREMNEHRNARKEPARMPMSTRTSKMDDFQFNADSFSSSSRSIKDASQLHLDLFKSSLSNNLKPTEDANFELSPPPSGSIESMHKYNEPNLTHNKNIVSDH
jgi:hypothetical protein